MSAKLEEKNRLARELLGMQMEITTSFYVPRFDREVEFDVVLEIEEPEDFLDVIEVEDYSEYNAQQFVEQVITCDALTDVENYETYGLNVVSAT